MNRQPQQFVEADNGRRIERNTFQGETSGLQRFEHGEPVRDFRQPKVPVRPVVDQEQARENQARIQQSIQESQQRAEELTNQLIQERDRVSSLAGAERTGVIRAEQQGAELTQNARNQRIWRTGRSGRAHREAGRGQVFDPVTRTWYHGNRGDQPTDRTAVVQAEFEQQQHFDRFSQGRTPEEVERWGVQTPRASVEDFSAPALSAREIGFLRQNNPEAFNTYQREVERGLMEFETAISGLSNEDGELDSGRAIQHLANLGISPTAASEVGRVVKQYAEQSKVYASQMRQAKLQLRDLELNVESKELAGSALALGMKQASSGNVTTQQAYALQGMTQGERNHFHISQHIGVNPEADQRWKDREIGKLTEGWGVDPSLETISIEAGVEQRFADDARTAFESVYNQASQSPLMITDLLQSVVEFVFDGPEYEDLNDNTKKYLLETAWDVAVNFLNERVEQRQVEIEEAGSREVVSKFASDIARFEEMLLQGAFDDELHKRKDYINASQRDGDRVGIERAVDGFLAEKLNDLYNERMANLDGRSSVYLDLVFGETLANLNRNTKIDDDSPASILSKAFHIGRALMTEYADQHKAETVAAHANQFREHIQRSRLDNIEIGNDGMPQVRVFTVGDATYSTHIPVGANEITRMELANAEQIIKSHKDNSFVQQWLGQYDGGVVPPSDLANGLGQWVRVPSDAIFNEKNMGSGYRELAIRYATRPEGDVGAGVTGLQVLSEQTVASIPLSQGGINTREDFNEGVLPFRTVLSDPAWNSAERESRRKRTAGQRVRENALREIADSPHVRNVLSASDSTLKPEDLLRDFIDGDDLAHMLWTSEISANREKAVVIALGKAREAAQQREINLVYGNTHSIVSWETDMRYNNESYVNAQGYDLEQMLEALRDPNYPERVSLMDSMNGFELRNVVRELDKQRSRNEKAEVSADLNALTPANRAGLLGMGTHPKPFARDRAGEFGADDQSFPFQGKVTDEYIDTLREIAYSLIPEASGEREFDPEVPEREETNIMIARRTIRGLMREGVDLETSTRAQIIKGRFGEDRFQEMVNESARSLND